MLYETKQERLGLQKQVDLLKEKESALTQEIIDTLPKSSATGVAGRVAACRVVTKEVPTVTDWEALYAFIKKNNAFELLQRRLSVPAVTERWEEDVTVPGVGTFTEVKLSLTKSK
jgi:hypothetical protein